MSDKLDKDVLNTSTSNKQNSPENDELKLKGPRIKMSFLERFDYSHIPVTKPKKEKKDDFKK